MSKIVRKGITSFFRRNSAAEFPFEEFRQIAFGCATTCRYSVRELTERGVTPNFHTALLEQRADKLLMLGHSNFQIIAFAEPRPEYSCKLNFRDAENLAKYILEMYPSFSIASTAELDRKVEESDLCLLGHAELEQVKYWKPRTVGELAFNWWD